MFEIKEENKVTYGGQRPARVLAEVGNSLPLSTVALSVEIPFIDYRASDVCSVACNVQHELNDPRGGVETHPLPF